MCVCVACVCVWGGNAISKNLVPPLCVWVFVEYVWRVVHVCVCCMCVCVCVWGGGGGMLSVRTLCLLSVCGCLLSVWRVGMCVSVCVVCLCICVNMCMGGCGWVR